MFLLLVLAAVCAVLVLGGRKTLRPLFHLLSVLLTLPGFLFAVGCVVMHEATKRDSLFFLGVILSFLEAIYPWGALVLAVCIALLLAAGCRTSLRRLAAGTVALLVVGSAAVMYCVAELPDNADQLWFFVPGALALLIAGALFAWPGQEAREFALLYPGGVRIDSALCEDELAGLQGQPGFHRRETGAAGWVWYGLPVYREGSVAIAVELGFHDGGLRQISLFHDDPVLYGTGDGSGQENMEHVRVENTRTWLRARGFPVGHYPWGEVWASYDPRSNFGSGGIRYNLGARRRRMPARPARAVATHPTPAGQWPQEMV